MEKSVETAAQIAHYLLQIKAVVLRPDEPFTWASGWKSPIYCDNRLILSYPEVRSFVRDAFEQSIKENYGTCDHISGVATGGIAHAAFVAAKMNLPMSYVRSGKKAHGRQNQVEGVVAKGEKVVVIEDLISSGGSSLQALEALREKEADVLGLIAVFSYDFPKAEENFRNAHLPYRALCTFPTLLNSAKELGYINAEQVEVLSEWRESPDTWSVN